MAGCVVSAVALAGIADEGPTVDQVIEEIIAVAPDIVLVGNLHGAGVNPAVIGAVADRWPTLAFMHDLWWVTGRCAYTGTCNKLVMGCDASCPTPDEYPQLAPDLIYDAWADKRVVLSQKRHPILLAMSDWTRDVAMRALTTNDERRVDRMVLGLPTEVFRPFDRAAARRHIGLPEHKFLVLCPATNFRDLRKGTDQVRSVIEGTQGRDIAFVTVGHGTIEASVLDERVIALPYQTKPDDVARLYAAVDVILAPSREETLGQIYIEAAACGTPSIGFANTGVTDAVVNGVTGRLAPDGSTQSLLDSVMNFYDDRPGREALGHWARIHATSAWSLEACYRSLFQVLRRQGIIDRLNLPHKIGFGPKRSSDSVRAASDAETNWVPLSGVGSEEGPYPDSGVASRFRWLFAPQSEFELRAEATGPHVVALRFQNRLFPAQTMTIALDGVSIANVTMTQKSDEDFDTFIVERSLSRGRHRMSLSFGCGFDDGASSDRKLALRLDRFAFYPKAIGRAIPEGVTTGGSSDPSRGD